MSGNRNNGSWQPNGGYASNGVYAPNSNPNSFTVQNLGYSANHSGNAAPYPPAGPSSTSSYRPVAPSTFIPTPVPPGPPPSTQASSSRPRSNGAAPPPPSSRPEQQQQQLPQSPRASTAAGPSQPTIVHTKEDEDEDYLYDELDDEDDVPPTQTPTGFEPTQGLLSGVLKPYTESRYQCRYLNELIQFGDIELEPDYQREVVWTEARQSALIDSLFHNYYVPPILFAVSQAEDGSEKRVCIDGKQRLTSISLFMLGQIPWRPTDGPGKGKKYWYKLDPTGQRSSNQPLPLNEKKLFDMKLITVAEFRELPPEAERDIFQRVQLGMALSPAEKLRAMDTPYAKYIHAILQKHIYNDGGFLSVYNNWETTRGRDYQNVCVAVMMLEAYPNPKTSVAAGQITTWLSRVDNVEASLRKKVDAVLAIYIEILAKYQNRAIDTVPNKLAPIEFSFFFLIIEEYRRRSSAAEIATVIGELRAYIRSVDINIRSNNIIIKAMYDWLNGKEKPRKRAANSDSDSEDDDGGRAKRRRRRNASDDEEEDQNYVGGGISRSQAQHSRGSRRA